MVCKDEVIALAIRNADTLNENTKNGVKWLDQQRHLLQEYNELDKNTIPLTGDMIEY